MDNQQQVTQLDDNFLEQLGLGALTPEVRTSLLDHVKQELQLRIGMALADNLTDEQLNEFEQIMSQGASQEVASEWLNQNCPHYPEVVRGEVEKIKQELEQSREAILSGEVTFDNSDSE